ncbi:MAG: phospholipase D-like domain-containing protein, partial [Coriobacteriaceae bacterium]|nr:phospholipase D-like domain-containing protein [Coriobacteriaceae bacterium]
MDENGATGMALDDELLDAARTALIDSTFPSRPDLRPKLLSNDIHRGRKVVSSINSELSKCSSFNFSVAFITQGGIEPLLQTLRELEKKGVPGRVITTDYLAFSEPNALEKLDSLKNIEVRMYRTINSPNQFGFHTKGYLFAYPNGLKKALVGSSNMTQSALSVNREWNLELSSLGQGSLVQDIQTEFEDLWEKSVPLSEIIDLYRTIHDEKKQIVRQETIVSIDQIKLEPNSMQLGFIASLDELIARGASRALLISATGTGKTYASAFA